MVLKAADPFSSLLVVLHVCLCFTLQVKSSGRREVVRIKFCVLCFRLQTELWFRLHDIRTMMTSSVSLFGRLTLNL